MHSATPNTDPATVPDLLRSDAVTPPTRQVLLARLAHPAITAPEHFDADQFATLRAVCARLIPQDESGPAVDLPGLLDSSLVKAAGKGWRYDVLPPDASLYKAGMDGIEALALALHGQSFALLNADRQDALLTDIQHGLKSGIWQSLDAARFFVELLAALTELYYSHPLAKVAIGDVSFADAHGWQVPNLNKLPG